MPVNEDYKNFILDQLTGIGEFEVKKMFGGIALLYQGSAFAKIKHDKVWLKVGESNRRDFEQQNMPQYTYGKDNARKLNFYETPVDVIEDREKLVDWAKRSMAVALKNQVK